MVFTIINKVLISHAYMRLHMDQNKKSKRCRGEHLKKGETKTINIDIFAKEDEIPDSYIGKIIVRGKDTNGNSMEKIINVIIEISKVSHKIDKDSRGI